MSLSSFKSGSWNGRHLKITSVTQEEREGIVRGAIANRAFKISENRGFKPGRELEDWRRAESETMAPLNCGFLVTDHSIALCTDGACFGRGEIGICVEPRHLTICGTERTCMQEALPKSVGSKPADRLIIRSLELPLEIEPSEVSARFNGRMIEIELPRPFVKKRASAAS